MSYIISPLSYESALSLLYPGTAGISKTEMDKLGDLVMSVEELQQIMKDFSKANFLFANGIFILDSFTNKMKKSYLNEISKVGSFAGLNLNNINTFVDKSTKGQIKQMMDSLDPMACIVLINVIYFKDEWVKKFKAENTEAGKFTNSLGKTIQLPMMSESHYPLDYFKATGYEIGILKTKKGAEFGIIQGPQRNTVDIHSISTQSVSATVIIPKFKIETLMDFTEELKQKCPSLFNFNTANFSQMITLSPNDRRVAVSKVFQKAMIDLNEDGLTAAASTAIVMILEMAMKPYKDEVIFEVNKTFRFFIRYQGIIVFEGVFDPDE